MSDPTKPEPSAERTSADRIEAAEKRRAERKAATAKARADQYVTDIEAFDALEEEHGDTLSRLNVERYAPGCATFVVLKKPSAPQYKRFVDQVSRAADAKNLGARRQAQDLLATSCWIYPKEEAERASMLEQFPGLLVSIGIEASKLAEAKAEDEGKG